MDLRRASPRWSRPLRGQRGIGLMEVVVSTVIATIAVVALAYTFSSGRGLVDRFQMARMALAAAQRRMELLEAAGDASPDLAVPSTHGWQPVQVDGAPLLQERWTVAAWTDPTTHHTAGSADLKQVTVVVGWGGRSQAETIQLTRLFHAR